ncbi:MAG: methyl-accepting chemotaxis sensory transducer, partial [Herbinix sp.]|nr:methyl-accepting chemotaxis sensory transducer [Herbinix sp.]
MDKDDNKLSVKETEEKITDDMNADKNIPVENITEEKIASDVIMEEKTKNAKFSKGRKTKDNTLSPKHGFVPKLNLKEKTTKLTNLLKMSVNQDNETSKPNVPQNAFLRRISGIRTTILLGFAVPIFLMAVFGVVSYNRSSNAIIQNYENIASNALSAVRDYIFLGIDAVSSKSYELTDTKNIKNYYNNTDQLSAEESIAAFEKVQTELANAKSSHSFIYAMHIIGEQGDSISSVDELPADMYAGFLESEEGKTITTSLERYVWVGKHNYIDEKLNHKQVNYSTSIIRKMAENNGFIIIDVPKTELEHAVSNIKLGEGSIVGFVTSDGGETLANTEETAVFSTT